MQGSRSASRSCNASISRPGCDEYFYGRIAHRGRDAKLGEEFKSIAISHGVTYVDILHDFRNIPNPERGYFPVDGHPNASGHATLSLLLAKELTSGAIPALKVAAQPQAGPEQEK